MAEQGSPLVEVTGCLVAGFELSIEMAAVEPGCNHPSVCRHTEH